MNTRKLEYLTTLEETGSIKATAEKYFISPSSISQCLKKEEKEIGYPLFEYTNHRMVPTKAGLIYLKGLREILRIREETFARLDVIPKYQNAIRIAAAPMLYERVSALLLPRLQAAMPDSSFALLRTGSRLGLEYLSNGLADFALLCLPALKDPLIAAELLDEDYLVLTAPRSYLRRHPDQPLTMEDFAPLPFILLRSTSGMRQAENEILTSHHITLNRIYEVDDFIMAKSFLEEGRGATFLPASMLPDAAEQHFVFFMPNPPQKFKLILAYLNYKEHDKTSQDIPKLIRKLW